MVIDSTPETNERDVQWLNPSDTSDKAVLTKILHRFSNRIDFDEEKVDGQKFDGFKGFV